jgi:hypothetical protein
MAWIWAGATFSFSSGSAVLGAEPEALEELAAGSLAPGGVREMRAKPKMIRLVTGGADDFLRLRRERGHALATAHAVPTNTRRLTRWGA